MGYDAGAGHLPGLSGINRYGTGEEIVVDNNGSGPEGEQVLTKNTGGIPGNGTKK